ncbi:MAG: hypothetical protein GY765_02510, partial [bacterium]|nr:hypothetical protein [bacterium]
MEAENISFTDGAYLNSTSYSAGRGGSIILRASEAVSFTGERSTGYGSMIQSSTLHGLEGSGAGNLLIEAKNISFADGAYINSKTAGNGNGGLTTLRASETVLFAGESSLGSASNISIDTTSKYEGNAGNLNIEAGNIIFTEGAYVSSTTYGNGMGGVIDLNAFDTVLFTGKMDNGMSSMIQLETGAEESVGDAGSLLVKAANILFENGAYISGTSFGRGNPGSITLRADEQIRFTGKGRGGVTSRTGGESLGDNEYTITLEAQDIL